MLDLIMTNCDGYNTCTKLAPLGTNEHCCILVPSTNKPKQKFVSVTKRKYTPKSKNNIKLDIIKEDWAQVFAARTVDEKADALHAAIENILDTHAPSTKVRVRKDIPENDLIRKIRRAKDRAQRQGRRAWKPLANLLEKLVRKHERAKYQQLLNNAIAD